MQQSRLPRFQRLGARAALIGSALVLAAASVPATSRLRIDELPALFDESQRALTAEVVVVHYGFDERRLHATFVTRKVEDRLFGDDLPSPGERLELKIYGAPEPMPDGSSLYVSGTPHYRIGERLLLPLIDTSAWGFTNTAGLHQGAFRI
ncbi:MAG: hypothetical protein JSV80_05260 [Acidobacteriota bacterium]|nr:MAG: hypothetical protein JSV80_05260 [Acidobacteriota bacterium]